MRKSIWIFLLSFMVFARSESLQASDEEIDTLTSSEKSQPLSRKPIDYSTIRSCIEDIVGSLRDGDPVSKDSIKKLIDNVVEETPTDEAGLIQFIDIAGAIMKGESKGRQEEERYQVNIDSFLQTLKDRAKTEPLGKVEKVMTLVGRAY